MDITIPDKKLRKLCTDQKTHDRELGAAGGRKLRARLADLQAAARVTDLVAGRPHPLKGDRAGEFAVDLDGGRRLVFRAAQEPPPTRDDGGIDWREVTAVAIVYLGDYHD